LQETTGFPAPHHRPNGQPRTLDIRMVPQRFKSTKDDCNRNLRLGRRSPRDWSEMIVYRHRDIRWLEEAACRSVSPREDWPTPEILCLACLARRGFVSYTPRDLVLSPKAQTQPRVCDWPSQLIF